MRDDPLRLVCWPEEWIRAAVNAGFATYRSDGVCIFLSEEFRKKLQQFACEITEVYEHDSENVV